MPDVGVLNLKIKDNSEQAGQGLSELARALSAVKTAMADFTLSKVGQQVKNLATKIGETQGSNAVIKNLTGMFNALSNYSKIKNLTIDTEPIEKLKTALGTGINVGKVGTEINKLREAFTGDWGDESKVAFITGSMEGLATASERLASANAAVVIRDVSKSIEKYAAAIGQVSGGGAHDYLTQQIFNAVGTDTTSVGTNITSGISQGVEQGKEEAVSATIDVADAMIESAKGRFGIASPSKEFERIGEYCMEGLVQGLVKTRSEVQHSLVQIAEDAKESISTAMNTGSVGGGFRKYVDDVNAVIPALREYRDLALSMESKKDIAGFNKKSGEELIASMQTAKENVAEVAGNISTVAEATEKAATAAEAVGTKIEQTTEKAKESAKEVKGYYASIEDAFNGIRNGKKVENDLMSSWLHGNGTKGEQDYGFRTLAKDLGMSIDEVRQKVNELLDAEKRLADQTANIGTSGTDAADKTKEQLTTTTQASQDATDRFKQLTDAQEETTKSAFSLHDAYGSLKSGIKAMFPTITSLIKRFTSMAKMRMLRYVIREIAKGFREGVQNVYEYSKAIGSGFAPSMDSAASALAQMKNSIGAAAAPVIQSLIPVLKQVVDWFINLLNYANQFFALLNGQKTWTRALPQTTEAFGKQEKAAKKTGAAIKDLLADWDELNIIQSNTSGAGTGAGTSTAEDYLSMFEEVNTFDNKVKDIFGFIKNNFDTIKTVAEGIGAAILLWRLSEGFGHALSMLQKLELAAGLVLIVDGVRVTAAAGRNLGKDFATGTIDWYNIEKAVRGVLETAFGSALVTLALGAGLAPGFTLGLTAGLLILGWEMQQGYYDTLYGDVHKDVEDIRTEIEEGILDIDAQATIDVTKAKIKDIDDAESEVRKALRDLEKNYPVGVEIAPDNAADFKDKVQALVTATNTLIASSEEFLGLTVPATPEFSGSFVKDAWGNVSAYVTELGKQIGEELDKGINDNVKLEELKNKLLELSDAIVNAQKSSEASARVGVLGSAVRQNNEFGQYDRETIANYVKEYNDYLSEKMGEATGFAERRYVETQKLIAGLEKSIDQIEKTPLSERTEEMKQDLEGMKKQLEVARKELIEAFGENGEYITRYAKENYFDPWTQAGRELFGNDIAGALQNAMNLYNNKKYLNEIGMRAATPAARDVQANDKWVDYYLRKQQDALLTAISEGTGMKMNEVKELLENAGIDPLSMFDENFVEQYRNRIISWLSSANLTNDQKGRILSSVGLNIDDLVEYAKNKDVLFNVGGNDTIAGATAKTNYANASEDVKAASEKVVEENVSSIDESVGKVSDGVFDLLDPIKGVYNWLVQNGTNMILFWNEFLKQQQEAGEWTLPDEYNTVKDAEEFVKNGGIIPVVEEKKKYDYSGDWVQGDDFTIADAQEFIKGYNEKDALRQLYNDLVGQLNSSDLGLSDKTDYLKYLMELYTNKDLERMKQELEILTENGWGSDNYRHGLGNGSIRNPNNYIASMGGPLGKRPDVGYPTDNPYFVYPNKVGAAEGEDISGDVAKGTKEANKTSEELLRQTAGYLLQLLNKNWTVNVTPTAAWGQHNAKSNDKYTYITGVEMV